jgi:DNA-binding transcriptional LysR family regulator
MLYTTEDTTGALLRDVARGRLDPAITFCAPEPPAGVELLPLRDEPAVVHLRSDHPLATRAPLQLGDLADETILIGATEIRGVSTAMSFRPSAPPVSVRVCWRTPIPI